MSDELREMLAETFKESEGKKESVVETAAKLEPEEKKEPVVEEKEEPTSKPAKAEESQEGDKEVKEPVTADPKAEAVDDATPKVEEPLLAQDKAPAGWTPKVREMWATVPKEVREEIIRREEASAQGVRKLQADIEPMRGFVQQLDPFIKEAFQNGANPGQYIGQVMASERALRNPDPNARFEALVAIADQYGIPLREVINQSVGREVIATQPKQPQVPTEVQQELVAQRQWREQQEQQAMMKEIDDFAKTNEFFNDVRPTMANLITANPNMTLKEAYDAAIWADPKVREVLISRTATKKDPIIEKQKAAVQGGGNEEVHVRTKGKNEESTLDDDLRESIVALAGRS